MHGGHRDRQRLDTACRAARREGLQRRPRVPLRRVPTHVSRCVHRARDLVVSFAKGVVLRPAEPRVPPNALRAAQARAEGLLHRDARARGHLRTRKQRVTARHDERHEWERDAGVLRARAWRHAVLLPGYAAPAAARTLMRGTKTCPCTTSLGRSHHITSHHVAACRHAPRGGSRARAARAAAPRASSQRARRCADIAPGRAPPSQRLPSHQRAHSAARCSGGSSAG